MIRIINPNQRTLGAGGGDQLPIKRESETSYSRIMGRDELGLLLRIVLNSNLTLMQTGTRENQRI